MRLNELNERLLRVQREHGDIPVMLSVSNEGEEILGSGEVLLHGDINMRVTVEQDHDTEGMFVRIQADDKE